jgi:hypothetical protein
MSKRMRLTLRKMIGSSLQFRRYDHERHGVIETLAQDSVIYVRPRFANGRSLRTAGAKTPSCARKRRCLGHMASFDRRED